MKELTAKEYAKLEKDLAFAVNAAKVMVYHCHGFSNTEIKELMGGMPESSIRRILSKMKKLPSK